MIGFFKLFLYPFYFLFTRLFNHRVSFGKRVISLLFTVFVLFPIWVLEMGAITLASWFILQFLGIAYVSVPVQGASMLPTLPIRGSVEFKRYPTIEQFKPTIHKGDMVVFENETTRAELKREGKDSTGFVKRVVGLPGDRVMMKDGFVYVNDTFIEEPYILKPRSTFGSEKFLDCQELRVPNNKIFVLGDNRKASMDSRHIGLISYEDIEFYRSFIDQEPFQKNWRDARKDEETALSSIFSINEYIELLNKERKGAGLLPLTHNPKLDQSAKLRAEVMLKYDDLSFEATRSGYPMEKALAEAKYSNIVYGEFPILGYYDAEELYESFFELSTTADFLLNKDYQEIGVSSFVGDLHGCPAQIVVQHLAGYVPPNYEQETIDSWKELATRLKEVQPSWQRLKERKEFYDKNKTEIDRINEIIATRIAHAEAIIKRMEAKEWLTDEEDRYTDEDVNLHNEQNALADKINNSTSQ